MKPATDLWRLVIAWDNLVLALRKGRRGKRDRAAVCRFEFSQEFMLLRLARDIQVLNFGKYEQGIRQLEEVGRLLGDWRKRTER